MLPPNRGVFLLESYDSEEKVNLSKGYWKPKRKVWVAMHFSEIIKQP